jgi:carbamoyl-phosphate synthase large subunit
MGAKLADMNLRNNNLTHFGVKEAVFPFNMFPEVDPVLGPEMRSTGEVLGMAETFGLAFAKAQEAAGGPLPISGKALITVANDAKPGILETARQLGELGFGILATRGTQRFLEENGVPCEVINKMSEGRPNIVDAIVNGEITMIVNTPKGKLASQDDAYVRKAAIKHKIPYITTTAAAFAAARGIRARKEERDVTRSLQEYHERLER